MKLISCVAKTQEGLEDVLLAEIEHLGGVNAVKGKRHVSFETDKEGLYRMNYNLRTAMNILVPIAKARVKNTDQLYAFAIRVKWDKYMSVDKTFAITSSVNSEHFTHSQYAALKVKDAIADYFRKFYGSRPNVERDLPDIKIDVHIDRENVTLSLDSSGNSLFKRGYRKNAGHAPINEVLAAGMVLLSGWDKKSDFKDPMCGSGTIAIEAYMMMCKIPAGICRLRFGFQDWDDFDKKLWLKVKEESNAQRIEPVAQVVGTDILHEAIEQAVKNVERIPGEKTIEFKVLDFFQEPIPPGTFMVVNPPYDHRIGQHNILEFYEKIGSTLKKKGLGSTTWILTGNMEALHQVGLKASKKYHLMNGSIPCRYNKYEVYEGSKKKKFQKESPST